MSRNETSAWSPTIIDIVSKIPLQNIVTPAESYAIAFKVSDTNGSSGFYYIQPDHNDSKILEEIRQTLLGMEKKYAPQAVAKFQSEGETSK